MGVSHIVVKKGVYSGEMGRFWEGRISKGEYILKGRCRFWEDEIDSVSIAYSCRKGEYILERCGRF